MTAPRPRWSWALDREEAQKFQEEASRLVGQRLVGVRYIDIDYGAEKYRRGASGPRNVESADEWRLPTWVHSACDSVDFAVELVTASGARFTASWDSPGTREGLGLRELAAIGSAVSSDAGVAIWDVSQRSRWERLLEAPVEAVDLHYEPWDDAGAYWCRRIDLHIARRDVVFLLAEGAWQSNGLALSADNVAVVFDEPIRPPW